MAATQTVAQSLELRKPDENRANAESDSRYPRTSTLKPSHGVITLHGYGIAVRVDRSHLILEDGVGTDRRQGRFPRVGHGLKRLVVVGSDGMVSLAALRWLADQEASFVMLDRDGSVLMTTGPVHSSEAKLRRAQALALQNGAALRISSELIDRKLAGQEKLAREKLKDESAAMMIRQLRSEIAEVESIAQARLIEAQAAKIYWTTWRSVEVMFPRKDMARVPEHWRTFGSRMSLLTGTARVATNPVNAILNYLYAVLEAESRFEALKLGLDPGIGVLHFDASYRDSLACDLMEPIRPEVDAFVLDWLTKEPLSRNWFFEQRDGTCRLMAALASKLSQTAQTWARLVAPIAGWFVKEISKPSVRQIESAKQPANHKQRERGDRGAWNKRPPTFNPDNICRGCGEKIAKPHTNCNQCSIQINFERMARAARLGRVAAHAPEAQAKRAATQKVNAYARWDWDPSTQPKWLTAQFYRRQIQPTIALIPGSKIAAILGASRSYANEIRKGRMPHPRHWKALAELAGLNRK
jgi:CRISPR-associated endonuclease Cas1